MRISPLLPTRDFRSTLTVTGNRRFNMKRQRFHVRPSETERQLPDQSRQELKERLRRKEDWLEKALDIHFRTRLRQEVESVGD